LAWSDGKGQLVLSLHSSYELSDDSDMHTVHTLVKVYPHYGALYYCQITAIIILMISPL